MFKIEDILLRIPNAMSDDECDFLIEHHKQNEEEHILEHCPDANTGVDTYSSFKCVMLKQYSEPHNIVHSKTKQMVERWKDHLVKFNAFHLPLLFGPDTGLNYSHVYRLLKYEPGTKIHPHSDYDNFTLGSCTFNLNDEYTGGVFKFWNGQYEVELKKGEAMIWPADYFWVHEIGRIETGLRYSTNCFLRSIGTDLFNEQFEYVQRERDLRMTNPTNSEYGQYFWRT